MIQLVVQQLCAAFLFIFCRLFPINAVLNLFLWLPIRVAYAIYCFMTLPIRFVNDLHEQQQEDHTVPNRPEIAQRLPNEIWNKIFLLLQFQTYQNLPLVSLRFASLVQRILNVHTKDLGPFVIRRQNWGRRAIIVSEQNNGNEMRLPAELVPTYVRGFHAITIRYTNDEVMHFLLSTIRRLLANNRVHLLVENVKGIDEAWLQQILEVISPTVHSLEGHLSFITADFLQNCPQLKFIKSTDEFNPQNALLDRDGVPLFQTILNWATGERQDVTERQQLRILDFHCYVCPQMAQQLETAFLNSSKPITYVVAHKWRMFDNVHQTNPTTGESFDYEWEEIYQLKRGPQNWTEQNWLERIQQIIQQTAPPRRGVIRLDVGATAGGANRRQRNCVIC
ncbi:hypothetical protein niasHS_016987 [Heterodera schachtii]|uniref:F-box domain-containing protein n=1 Tax=Heterodera schachtii TaxID=97005 RepID=A0ABD2IC29_HETSC